MDTIYIKRNTDVSYISECATSGTAEFVISICSMVCSRGNIEVTYFQNIVFKCPLIKL